MQADVTLTMRMAVMIEVPALLLVELKNTWMNGYPVGELIAVIMSPTTKQKVMIITKPMAPLTPAAHMMALGSTRDASLISSDICTAESAPKRV